MHLRSRGADFRQPIPIPFRRHRFIGRARRADAWLVAWMARRNVLFQRISLGIVFLWFGALKFFPGLSPAEDLATRTLNVLTLGAVPPRVSLVILAAWECAIGLGLILGVAMRATLALLFLQMLGTLMPIALFPHELFSRPFSVPTLEGQYIIKNLVLISAGLSIGSTLQRGAGRDEAQVISLEPISWLEVARPPKKTAGA